ncbi:MAG: hypothetical protein WCL70_13325 [Paludibacter sp.]
MPKEDYLLKYLEKLSRVIAAMLGFRDKGFPEDALRLADETYRELLGLNLDELEVMPIERFQELIKKGGYSSSYLEILAQLAYETAKSGEKTGKSKEFHRKALEIYRLLNEKDKTFSFEREMIISELKQLTVNS